MLLAFSRDGPAVDVADRRTPHGAPDQRDQHRPAARRAGSRRAGAQPRRPPRRLRRHHGCRSRRDGGRHRRPRGGRLRPRDARCRAARDALRPAAGTCGSGPATSTPDPPRGVACVTWSKAGICRHGVAFVMVEGSPEPGRVSGQPRRQQGHPLPWPPSSSASSVRCWPSSAWRSPSSASGSPPSWAARAPRSSPCDPATADPVLIGPDVLNRVDADVVVTATPTAGGSVWMALANPSDAERGGRRREARRGHRGVGARLDAR